MPSHQTTSASSPRFALISVANKLGLEHLAQCFTACNIHILATGATRSYLEQHGIIATDVSNYTEFPEIMSGRVKTLHPKIYGGILARRNEDQALLNEHNITLIDFVVVNFYPFVQTIQKQDTTFEQAIEDIDIGGPCLVRACAKNHAYTTVITDPEDYSQLITEIKTHRGSTLPQTRLYCAAKAFALTAYYDSMIAHYLKQYVPTQTLFPEQLHLMYNKKRTLRYGENPHQQAAFYEDPQPRSTLSLSLIEQHQGKPLSWNNIADTDVAIHCVRQWTTPVAACVIIKHATPCGVACAASTVEAYQQALSTNPKAAFGGILAFNQTLDAATAQAIVGHHFVEVIAACGIEPAALQALSQKPNIRVLDYTNALQKTYHNHKPPLHYKSVQGGLLVQQADNVSLNPDQLTVVTQQTPSKSVWDDLIFAWKVCQWTKSNAIVCAYNQTTLGIGSGQVSRIASTEIALQQALRQHNPLPPATILASDAFFPFSDAIEAAAQAGIVAIIQPGGSIHDDQVIAAANKAGISMVLTHIRHFYH